MKNKIILIVTVILFASIFIAIPFAAFLGLFKMDVFMISVCYVYVMLKFFSNVSED